MVTQKHQLFRKEATERISSPERLDQIMQVVSFQKWIPLAAFGTIIAAGVAWSVVGRIPVIVEGQGILIFPSQVTTFQSPGEGRLLTLNVQVGDVVKKGQVIGTLDQAELQKKLQQTQAKLGELQNQNSDAGSLQRQRIGLDQVALQQQRSTLNSSLQAAQTVSPLLREKGLESIRSDRQNLEQQLETTRELLPTLQQRFVIRQQLFSEGAVSGDAVLQSKQELINGETKVNDAQSQLKQLDVKEADAQRQFLESLNSIQNLQTELKSLDTKQASQAQQDLAASTNRQKEIQETIREVAQLQLQLKNTSQIISQHTGRVIELSASPGQLIAQGSSIGAIEAQNPTGKLMSVAFFPAGEGKKLKSGMKLQVTPTTVKREEFGGIVGTVSYISAFPVTQEGALRLIGSAEVVKGLLSQGPQIEAHAELQPDTSTVSALKWSSSNGPPQKMTSGTPTTVRATVEERAPISFVLPIFKSWTGVY